MRISDWSSDVCSSDLQFLAEVIKQVEADLKTARLTARVTGRPKHYYSIYQKMIVGGREFSDIYDLVGIRILVEEDRECYSALGIVHSRWNPVLGRFKDYIAMPKFNMYQRSEEHTSELQSLMRISYAVFCLKK